ncbi:MAG: DinB family protein, partial [Planctomycetota bacterium]|nr:DinB family protein [Planctomycetota bacterium]
LVAWFLSMSGERLAAALPEDWQVFAKSYGVLINTIAWHEGMHAGQLTVIRRELGLGPKFG